MMENKTIISLVMSGLFGVYKIFNSSKNQQYSELSFIERNLVPLITTNLNELSQIKHQLPFDSNQYYYRATIINSGTTDIYKTLIIKPIKIEFEKDSKILNFKFLDADNDVDLSSEISQNVLEIKWDILKPLEKFSFELIIESKQNLKILRFYEMLKISSRIAGIEKIKKTSSWALENSSKKMLNESIPTYFFLIILYVLFSFPLYTGIKSYYNPKVKTSYDFISKSLNEKIEDIEYYNSSTVKIIGANKTTLVSNEQLQNEFKVKVLTEKKENMYWLIILGVVSWILISIRTVSLIKEDVHNFKLKRIYRALQ